MNLDGTGEKILLPNLTFWSYVVSNGYVFYVDTDNSLLYRMTLDGNGKTAISTKSVEHRDGDYSLFDNTLFFSKEGVINTRNW